MSSVLPSELRSCARPLPSSVQFSSVSFCFVVLSVESVFGCVEHVNTGRMEATLEEAHTQKVSRFLRPGRVLNPWNRDLDMLWSGDF